MMTPTPTSRRPAASRNLAGRMAKNRLFQWLSVAVACCSVCILLILLGVIGFHGLRYLDSDFLTSAPSRHAEEAGMGPAIWGSIWVCVTCTLLALPIGVGTAIFLEEYRPVSAVGRRIFGLIQLNITNLAGVPSIVYGILGLTVFVQWFGIAGNANEPIGTIGQKWYDSMIDETGRLLLVRVTGREAPTIRIAPSLAYRDESGHRVTVDVRQEKEIAPVRSAIVDAVDALVDAVSDRVEAGGGESPDTALGVMRSVLSEVALPDSIVPDEASLERWAALVSEASHQTGREFRKGMRAVSTAALTDLSRLALPNVLSDEAALTRTDRKSFYYIQIPFGRGVLAGGLTLMLVVLPVLIVSSQEALRAVPSSLRQGSLALGATRWQTIYRMTLPAAVPGIMTGAILSVSRAIGEAAPILIIAGIVFIRFTPHHLMDEFTAMPLQIFDWAGRPQVEFHDVAAAGIIVLLCVLLTFNATAVLLRHKCQRERQ